MPNRLATQGALIAAMAGFAPPGIRTACRAIEAGDEALLTEDEARSISTVVAHARDASGTARQEARRLLEAGGIAGHSLLKTASGAPVWPDGIVGSMAHDGCFAVAAVAPALAFSALGIDLEPAEPLPQEVADIVMTGEDRIAGVDPLLAGRLLFSAKEAIYKAVFPKDGQILGYEDIAVDFASRQGVVRSGRRLSLAYCLAPRLVVLAYEAA
jgi:4'-phosphopantetheinyl transferase EntD